MPCDLRKKAALIFFLRDIRWCLMSLFGSVIPSLFFLFFIYIYCPDINLNWIENFVLPFTRKTKKLTKLNRMICTNVALFCFVAFDKQEAYYLLCNLFNLRDRSVLRMCFNVSLTTHIILFLLQSFIVAGTLF